MAPHVTHVGVHDHGFNNVSTWGALRRLALEGRYSPEGRERELCELALKASGAVQARRWTRTADGGGFIYSFNGPHSLFADTMRSLRSHALAHRLGHALLEEGDRPVSLLERPCLHARTTSRFAVYKGRGRDVWDERGRVAHESIFNVTDGAYRCPGTQQGYSPFTTWTRGQAWVLLGFLRGRNFQQVPDITARICGICPVAYQMSPVQALENALDIQITPEIRSLRRLLYDAEYIESHALHIYMLQAPDLLGYESALSLAEVAPDVVKKALRLKKIGNLILKTIGGRSVHPVNTAVGGFYRWPSTGTIKALLPDLEWGLEAAIETARWAATLPFPELEVKDYEFVATHNLDEYGILQGDILSSTGMSIPVADFNSHFIETHVRHSNALHSHTASGNPYLTGPLARLNLNHEQLGAEAQMLLEGSDVELPLTNPYKQLLARAIELMEVFFPEP